MLTAFPCDTTLARGCDIFLYSFKTPHIRLVLAVGSPHGASRTQWAGSFVELLIIHA